MTKETGGPAFPTENARQTGNTTWHYEGMTLRDYFAAKAMQGLIAGHFSHYGHENYWLRDGIAQEAYEVADAMIAERNK